MDYEFFFTVNHLYNHLNDYEFVNKQFDIQKHGHVHAIVKVYKVELNTVICNVKISKTVLPKLLLIHISNNLNFIKLVIY